MSTQQRWVRFAHAGQTGFGTIDQNDQIQVHTGDMFAGAQPSGQVLALADVKVLMPTEPTKVIAMWNNFHALAAKLNLQDPPEPLYLLKPANSFLDPGETIRAPRSGGKVAFEGELAIVIGKTASGVSEADALSHVFGYTCVNDVTQVEILNRDPSFAQWCRSKGFDTFCPFGPYVATGLDPASLTVKTVLNGDVRQDYPISDMRFSVQRLVSLISQDLTLNPGDLILCGTSVGVGSMKPGSLVEIEIPGIGKLSNRFE
jgi:2-keto-4-pentenoate hydratase/2-oxohepta-3-ene-1,7-dioic acid hydratase in catechol pathway